MKFKMIAAIGQNLELGKNNDLIWSLPGDLKFFKEVTTGHTVLMGKNTFYSLPKVLPNRKNIVITDEYIDNSEIEQFNSLEIVPDPEKTFIEYMEENLEIIKKCMY